MPSGNPTIKVQPLDLGSFLERKRKPLKKWLEQTGINSESSLKIFLQNSEWSVTDSLLESIRATFVIPTTTLPIESIAEKKESENNTISNFTDSNKTEEKTVIETNLVSDIYLNLENKNSENSSDILNSLNSSSEAPEEVSDTVALQTNKRKERNR